MTYLSVAVACVGALCLVNLMLIVALARRQRSYGEESARPSDFALLTLQKGSDAPDFVATSVNGSRRSLGDLKGSPSLIAFFAATCRGCRAQIPAFVKLAHTVPGGPLHVLAVIDGDGDEGRDLLSALVEVATVIMEPERGSIADAFSVRAYPTFYVLDGEARIRASGTSVPRFDITRLESGMAS